MNLFGVLKYKKMAEDFLQSSGLPFTIIRYGESCTYLVSFDDRFMNEWNTLLWILCPVSSFHILIHVRPGRLTDGPYTSYDLNTLLQSTAGQRRAVLIGQGI